MNRVTDKIERTKKIVAERIALGLVTAERVEQNRKILDLEPDLYCDFQNRKSIASMDNTLTLDEAQSIYGFLGNTPEHFNEQPYEVKFVLMQVYQELVSKSMKRKIAG